MGIVISDNIIIRYHQGNEQLGRRKLMVWGKKGWLWGSEVKHTLGFAVNCSKLMKRERAGGGLGDTAAR